MHIHVTQLLETCSNDKQAQYDEKFQLTQLYLMLKWHLKLHADCR